MLVSTEADEVDDSVIAVMALAAAPADDGVKAETDATPQSAPTIAREYIIA